MSNAATAKVDTPPAKKSASELTNFDREVQEAKQKIRDQVGSGLGNSFIKFKNKKFVFPDGREGEEIRVVPIAFVTRHLYYDKPYAKGVFNPPKCWAVSEFKKHLIPPDTVPKPESDTGCDDCKHFKWGSGNNNVGTACKVQKLIAVVAHDAGADDAIFLLPVAVMGVKSFDKFVNLVQNKHGSLPIFVNMRVSFDPKEEYARLVFDDPQENKLVKDHWERRSEAMSMLVADPLGDA